MTGYYDIVLGLIPLAMAGITGSLVVAGFALTTAIPMASVVAVGLIGHAMFVRAPVDPVPTEPTESVQSDPVQATE
ncbi:hypothetical protein NDI56_02515 [Haloarcula sp. S1CR25-12]|uniref:Uncharacterized protein n=1 Tax=Haloarcula saliterrae TaxID=2950534 RepID=A0ABU2F8W8_9EURY|nr:hypothetical protein [Haloarcula sp. S1CR25-12]MDS0258280.1 hypothetical protein [Haloarcula sp. S1CR25-12]